MPSATSAQPSNPFIKQLASSNRTERDRALSSLRTYLHRTKSFTATDFLKLWKGLFYCMWMSDKPRNQQRLARDLAELLDAVTSRANFLGFLEAFWTTMAREWQVIDSLRMDKYLYLVRCYVNKGFEHVGRKDWGDEEFLEQYLEVMKSVPFNARDGKIPNGLRYHVIDIYVDELDKVDTKRNVPLEKVIKPLKQLGIDTPTKAVRSRVNEALEDERLSDWQKVDKDEDESEDKEGSAQANESEGDDEEFGGFDD
ncbi:Hypothetical protein R9X50_00255500 [Acrodontium crateriforme]|uniref:Uncharacterized protein n=1 Tax=Acrodontium crateriforme TaxID=150365 RepID=A0AAQ3M2D8_9PEZI|nr:Hypothetical protein R9X50_00255500 [Acrodontium crateriforme]